MIHFNDLTKKLIDYKQKRFLLAVSGGLDSMALLTIFDHFKKHFDFDFAVSYFHHGPTADRQLLDYRFNAYDLVKLACHQREVPFYSNYDDSSSESFLQGWQHSTQTEAEHRENRYSYFEQVMLQQGFDFLVLAHHRDDLLETRLMRMIRGVGPQGLPAMSFLTDNRLRPLLSYSRKELKEFLVEKKGGWLEDPSNTETHHFRNWLRQKWLRDLEDKQPGALGSLARSLDLMVRSSQNSTPVSPSLQNGEVVLSEWLCLGLAQKQQVLATYMKSQGLKNYGLSHINEVIKRLDTEKKSHTFNLLGRCWKVDAGRMRVKPSS